MTEAEITETEVTEAVADVEAEEIRDARAVLAKNRQLVSDMAKIRDRNAALEELGRTLGDEAVADPRGYLAKRSADAAAARERERVVKEATLKAIAVEGRNVRGDVEELLAKVAADPRVTVDADGKVNLADVLERAAPKRAAPMPWHPPVSYGTTAPKTLEELQAKGSDAVKLFAERSPDLYKSLREDFQHRLAKGERPR